LVARRAVYDELVRDLASVRDLAPVLDSLSASGTPRAVSTQRLATRGAIASSFSLIESFVRVSFRTAVDRVSTRGRPASQLPPFLVAGIESGTLAGLSFQIRVAPTGAKRKLLLDEAARLTSLAGGPALLPHYFAGHDSSNVSVQAISAMLKPLGVSKPWQCLQTVGDRSGLLTADMKAELEDALRLRNLAAHDPGWIATTAHLEQVTRTMSGLALAFEVVLGLALGRLATPGSLSALLPSLLVSPHPLGIRKVRKDWRELGPGGVAGSALATDKRKAVALAKGRTGHAGAAVLDVTWGAIAWR